MKEKGKRIEHKQDFGIKNRTPTESWPYRRRLVNVPACIYRFRSLVLQPLLSWSFMAILIPFWGVLLSQSGSLPSSCRCITGLEQQQLTKTDLASSLSCRSIIAATWKNWSMHVWQEEDRPSCVCDRGSGSDGFNLMGEYVCVFVSFRFFIQNFPWPTSNLTAREVPFLA